MVLLEFEAVDWESRDKVLSSTTDMFRIWLCKQCSTFCASGKNMGRWFGVRVRSNTMSKLRGTAGRLAPLTTLSGPRALIFSLRRDEDGSVMAIMERHTNPILGATLSEYLSGRGRRTLTDIIGTTRDTLLRKLAYMQDSIGWDHMMEGKVTTLLREYQHIHLLTSESMLTADKELHLLHVTRGQWIYRNVSRHLCNMALRSILAMFLLTI